jgi:hypothetical protein
MNEDHDKDYKPESEGEDPQPSATGRGLRVAAVVFFCAMVAGAVYALHERAQAARLAVDYNQMSDSLSATQAQLASLSAKLQALTASNAETQPVTPSPAPGKTASVHHTRKKLQSRRRRAEDPGWKKMQTELAENQKQIEATRQDLDQTRTDFESKLNSTHDELNGSIARNHDQLVALQKRGQRLYYEFDLSKSKRFQHVGPVSIALRKANTKHLFCDLKLIVDDNLLTKKHVSLYEPVQFYPADYDQPLEIVIYQINKNEARGYVSAPRYGQSETAAQPAPASLTTSAQPAAAKSADLQRRPEPPQ